MGVLRRLCGCMGLAAVTAALSAGPALADEPVIQGSLSPSSVAIGQSSTLTYTFTGAGTAIDLSAQAPQGVTVGTGTVAGCGGTLKVGPETPPAYGSSTGVSLTGATVPASGSCSVSFPVTATSAGTLTFENGSYNNGSTASTTLTVPATASPATVQSAVAPSSLQVGQTASYTITITNPNTSAPLTGVRFETQQGDGLEPGAVTQNTCGGETASGASIYEIIHLPHVWLNDGTIPAGGSCQVTAQVTPVIATQSHNSVTVSSNEGGDSAPSLAQFTVTGPATNTPTPAPSNAFGHRAPKLGRDGTVRETVTLPGRGLLRARESWNGKQIARTRTTVTGKRALTITLRPGRAIRRRLSTHHRARITLSISYTPAGGTTRTITITTRTPRSAR